MTAYPTNLRSAERQTGMTMIEVMVAMLLGLILTGGAIQVFISNRAAYTFNEGLQRLQENGRFALDTLSYNVRMAGTLGCMAAVPLTNNLKDATTLPFNFAQGVVGYEAVGTAPASAKFTAASVNPPNSATAADWSPALPAPVLGNVIKGSDVLVVYAASPTAHSLVGTFNDGDTVHVGATTADYAVGDVAIVSDCQKASMFQITGVTAVGSTQVDLKHAASGTPGNALATWDTDQSYAFGAQIARAETWVYYVGSRGAGLSPALFQMRLQTNSATTTSALVAEEIVDGVETMQVMYGIDSDADGDVDSYVPASSVANWGQVVTVRIGLLMRSPEDTGGETDTAVYLVNDTDFDPTPTDDRRVRQVFTATTAIRNRLP